MRLIIVSILASLIAFSSIANAALPCCCFKSETTAQISQAESMATEASTMPCHETMQEDSDIENAPDCDKCGYCHVSHIFTIPTFLKLSQATEPHSLYETALATMNAFEPERQPQPPKTYS